MAARADLWTFPLLLTRTLSVPRAVNSDDDALIMNSGEPMFGLVQKTGSSEVSGGAGGIARGLKRKAAEAQSGGGDDDADNDNMLGGSDDGEGDGGPEQPKKKKKKGKQRGGRSHDKRQREQR